MIAAAIVSYWLTLAIFYAGYHIGRRRGRRDAEQSTQHMLHSAIFPLLIARGVTTAEFNLAIDQAGCGDPKCTDCGGIARTFGPN